MPFITIRRLLLTALAVAASHLPRLRSHRPAFTGSFRIRAVVRSLAPLCWSWTWRPGRRSRPRPTLAVGSRSAACEPEATASRQVPRASIAEADSSTRRGRERSRHGHPHGCPAQRRWLTSRGGLSNSGRSSRTSGRGPTTLQRYSPACRASASRATAACPVSPPFTAWPTTA